MYVGTGFGAGHISQAKAIAAAAEKRGVQSELVDFHELFGKKDKLRSYERSVSNHLKEKNLKSGARLAFDHENYYLRGVDKDKVKRYFDAHDGPVVMTMPHLQMAVRNVDKPIHIVHTDPEKWTGEYDRSLVSSGRRIHIGTKQVVGSLPLARETRTITGLPVHPDVLARKKRTGLMARKDHNITVSGGALGLEVLPMTHQVLQADLPPNAVIHAVAGRNKGLKRRLDALAKKDSRVQVHGFAPLGAMMQEADINVIRAHGTTFAETVASGKPAVYYAPDTNMLDYQGKLTKETALFGQKTVRHPAAIGLGSIPAAVGEVAQKDQKHLRLARAAKRRMGNPADQVVSHILKTASIEQGDVRRGTPTTHSLRDFQARLRPGDIIMTKPGSSGKSILTPIVRAHDALVGAKHPGWIHAAVHTGRGEVAHLDDKKLAKNERVIKQIPQVGRSRISLFDKSGYDMVALRPRSGTQDAVKRIGQIADSGVKMPAPRYLANLARTGGLLGPGEDFSDAVCTGIVGAAYEKAPLSKRNPLVMRPHDFMESHKVKHVLAYSRDKK